MDACLAVEQCFERIIGISVGAMDACLAAEQCLGYPCMTVKMIQLN
jgi:hypothetical protein